MRRPLVIRYMTDFEGLKVQRVAEFVLYEMPMRSEMRRHPIVETRTMLVLARPKLEQEPPWVPWRR